MDFKQQFKEYYEKKLQEDIELAQKSAAEQSYQTQAMNSSLDAVVMKYVGNGDIKVMMSTRLSKSLRRRCISNTMELPDILEDILGVLETILISTKTGIGGLMSGSKELKLIRSKA